MQPPQEAVVCFEDFGRCSPTKDSCSSYPKCRLNFFCCSSSRWWLSLQLKVGPRPSWKCFGQAWLGDPQIGTKYVDNKQHGTRVLEKHQNLKSSYQTCKPRSMIWKNQALHPKHFFFPKSSLWLKSVGGVHSWRCNEGMRGTIELHSKSCRKKQGEGDGKRTRTAPFESKLQIYKLWCVETPFKKQLFNINW